MKTTRMRRGFTLIELLLVMVILAVLAALVLPKFTGRTEDANKTAAQTQISSLFSTALDLYEADSGQFPTTAQGLQALRLQPTSAPEPKHWKGPYLKGNVPLDPWGNEYVYTSPGQQNPKGYDIVCVGPDGRQGSEDDITNWTTTR